MVQALLGSGMSEVGSGVGFVDIDCGLDLGSAGPGVLTVAALVDLDPATLAESALVDAVGRLDEQVAWLQSVRAGHLAEIARRHPAEVRPEPEPGEWGGRPVDAPEWEREAIGLRCAISGHEARARFEAAVALEERLPATARLLAAGAVSWPHVVALTHETAGLDPETSGGIERQVHADRRAVTAGQYRRRARRLVRAIRPPDAATCAERSLTAWSDEDGVQLAVRLDAEGGAVVATCLDALATPTDTGDDRPVATRRADALVELCRWRLGRGDLPPSASGLRPHLLVQVPLASLAGSVPGVADVGGAVVPAETARRIACDAGVSELLHAARVIDLGREQRFPTTALRRRLEARDGGCRFPTCNRPGARCHAHHVVHWAAGGETVEDNLMLLCSRHHHLVHEGGWNLAFDGDTAIWFGPDGAEHEAPSPLSRRPEPDEEFYAWLPAPPALLHPPLPQPPSPIERADAPPF